MPERARPDLLELYGVARGLPEAERTAFARAACGNNTALYQELVELLRIDVELDKVGIVSPNALDDMAGKRLGPYHLVRELGRGGMGAVYLARRVDGAFDRQVAIKVIAARRASPDLIKEFEQERRLAATLDHPNIVRLHDAGTQDGQLYFVMEYVDGLPIHRYCEEHRLTIRQQLELFRTVCHAVAYAHRNLIVHRDLKPGNILVDAQGNPKVLDFGIAKPITPAGLEDEDPTDPLARRMTFAYASPEQRAGLPTHTSMDVYALGIVLHKILIGHVPKAIEDDDATEAGVGAFPKPSAAASRDLPQEFARHIEGDLDAIIMRAIAPNPRDRYESVEAFAADIQRHLEHRPVVARPATTGYVVRRFLRRNRVPVAVGAALVVALGAAATSLYTSYRQAIEERGRAERRFTHAKRLAQSLFAIDTELGTVAGGTRPRLALVKAARDYLNAVRPEAGGDAFLTLELAQGYRRLGDVQGNPNVANLGDPAGAIDSYKQAESLLLDLNQRAASEPVQLALAETYASYGDVLRASGNDTQAMERYQDALRLAGELRKTASDNPRYMQLAAGVLRPMGDIRLAAKNTAQALDHFRAALQIDNALVGGAPGNAEYRRQLALSEIRMAAVAAEDGDVAAARRGLERARGVLEQLAKAGIGGASVERELAVGEARFGTLLSQTGDRAGRSYLARAVDVFRRLSASDRADVRLQADLGSALVQYGDAVRADATEQAARLYSEARDVVTRLPAEHGAVRGLAAAISVRMPESSLPSPVARLRIRQVVDGRQVDITPGQVPQQDTELLVTVAGPRHGAHYLLVFGARGSPQLLPDVRSEGSWRVKATGPPPAQTIMLVSARRPLAQSEQTAIIDAVSSVPDDRIVDSDSVVTWTEADLDIQSAAAARGDNRPKWIETVRAALLKVPDVVITARTFPLARKRN